MKIELKRISHNERLSQETNAYAADLWINGVKRGEVTNEGHGGADSFSDWAAQKELDAYGATLPKRKASFNDPKTGEPYEHEQDAESLVADELEKFLAAKHAKKAEAQIKGWTKTKIVFTTKDTPAGEFRTIKYKWTPANRAMVRAHMEKTYPDLVEIVNERFA